MGRSRRWSDAQFVQAAAKARSVAQVLRALGLNPTGANYMTVWTTVRRLTLDTSHWTGRGSNNGVSHVGGSPKVPAETVLSNDRYGGQKEKVYRLRRAMLEVGVLEVCSECGLPPEWNGRPLVLQVDHKNGNSLDNRPGNPRFLCPNCHSQTETFGTRNTGWRERQDLAPTPGRTSATGLTPQPPEGSMKKKHR